MTYSEYHGFRRGDFEFEGRHAIIVFPDDPEPRRRWILKMEYFDAFPSFHLEMIRRGWHLLFLENINRWGTEQDTDAKARFCGHVIKEFGLSEKACLEGMSCGGLCSVNFASKYPGYVSAMYLDAPVMNLLSCPMGFGRGIPLDGETGWNELKEAYGFELEELLAYRGHPIDKIDSIIKGRFPLALLYGDRDVLVPYPENGAFLERAYREAGLPLFSVCRKGCGHHPHGLDDPEELRKLCDFVENNSETEENDMDIKEILSKVDHTLLAVDATWEQIRGIIDDGIRYHTASVCIPASFVKKAAEYAGGRVKICTVIGFPNGYSTTRVKSFEAECAVEDGADEVDMVINVGWVKDGLYGQVLDDIRAVRKACDDAGAACGKRIILKVIIETCLLTDDEKIRMCEVVSDSGADFIKTSTGFSKGGATFDDIRLFKKHVAPHLKIKAAGGISSIEDAEKFIELGADRLGTSRIVKIVKNK